MLLQRRYFIDDFYYEVITKLAQAPAAIMGLIDPPGRVTEGDVRLADAFTEEDMTDFEPLGLRPALAVPRSGAPVS